MTLAGSSAIAHRDTLTDSERPNAREGGELLTVEVVGRAIAAQDAVTLWLARPGTRRGPLPYRPGQFTTLTLPGPHGTTVQRSYSLCGDGGPSQPWEITIKRQAGGLVSPYLCDAVRPGMTLHASAPAGTFFLPSRLRPEQPIVLVATGSGITPMMSFLRALARTPAATRPPVSLHYAYHSPEDGIYVRELLALDPEQRWLRQWHYLSTRGDRLTPAHVRAILGPTPAASEVYFCGNRELRAALRTDLERVGVGRFHVETFVSPRIAGSGGGATTAKSTGARVRVADDGRVLVTHPGETLLETLERGGYTCASSCRAGACGTCRLRLVAGNVRDDGDALTAKERTAGYVLSCVAQPQGEVTLAGVAPQGGRGGVVPGQVAASARSGGGHKGLRAALLAASVAVFLGAGHTIFASATTTSSTATGTSASSSASSSSSDDDSSGNTSLPSGTGSISTGSNQPSPSSSSSVS